MSRKQRVWALSMALSAALPMAARADFITTRSSNSTISDFSSSGTLLASHATGGNLETVAVGGNGNIYGTDLDGGVFKFAAGTLANSNMSTTGTAEFYYGTAVDSSGNVYFSTDGDNSNSSDIKVYRYINGTGAPVLFSDTGVNGSFSVRNSLAIDPITQNLFLADAANNKVLEYNTSGTLINTFTNGISSPWDIAVDALGDLYVSNTGTDSLVKILISNGSPTNVATGLNTPEGVAVDSANNVYELVTSAVGGTHSSVIEFTPSGTALGEVLNAGTQGQDYLAVTPVAAVPEPAALTIAGAGLAGLVLLVARRGKIFPK
jgi:hypothetical protein